MTGELSEHVLRSIFNEVIRPQLQARVLVGKGMERVVVMLGGQPASGKTRSLARVVEQYPGIVPVVGDDFRRYHPDYDRLMRDDPLRMPVVTASASGRWVEMSLDYLQAEGAPVLVETTMRSLPVVERTLSGFKAAGYVTDVRVLAVPPAVSRLGTVQRYVGQVEQNGAGRWVPSMMHDQAVHNMADTFSGLILAGLADRAMVVDRAGSTLWQMPTFTDGELVEVSARQGREALAAGQQLSALSMVEAQSWLEEFTRVVPQCLRAGGDDLDVANVVGLLASEARNIASIAWPKDASRQVGAAAEVAALREACFSADWVDGSVVDVRAAAAGHAAASRWFGHDVER